MKIIVDFDKLQDYQKLRHEELTAEWKEIEKIADFTERSKSMESNLAKRVELNRLISFNTSLLINSEFYHGDEDND